MIDARFSMIRVTTALVFAVLLGPGAGTAVADECTIAWSELHQTAKITLEPPGSARSIDTGEVCSEEIAFFRQETENVGCESADVAGGRTATLCTFGPEGSGRFTNWWLTVEANEDGEDELAACGMGSTAGWRHLFQVAPIAGLNPLPWLKDLDGDDAAELILWQRLPFGSMSEASQGLYPLVYSLSKDDDMLLLQDTDALRLPLAQAYEELAGKTGNSCHAAMAVALKEGQ